jgi:hypothetical protein
VANYFACRALTIREPEKEFGLESEEDGTDQHPFSNNRYGSSIKGFERGLTS